MTSEFDEQVFERIFSDAHVIDVDFSHWDKSISLCVLADHYVEWTNRMPVVAVDFLKTRQLNIDFPSSEYSLDDPHKHLQWMVYDFDVRRTNDTIRFKLFGSGSSPILEIESEDVLARPVPIEYLDRISTGWNKPFSGLARPGIEALVKSLKKHGQ